MLYFSSFSSFSTSPAALNVAASINGVANNILIQPQTLTRKPLKFVTLDRPEAQNALTLPMLRELQRNFDKWTQPGDPTKVVLISSSRKKAFCVGTDYSLLKDKGNAEYSKNLCQLAQTLRLKGYKKPIRISLLEGEVAGSGLGIAVHGHNSIRVVTERTKIRIPQCAVGTGLQGGMSRFLSLRLPRHTGVYLTLTAETISGPDCLKFGIGSHYCPSSLLAVLQTNIGEYLSIHPTRNDPEYLFSDLSDFMEQNIQQIIEYGARESLEEIRKESPELEKIYHIKYSIDNPKKLIMAKKTKEELIEEIPNIKTISEVFSGKNVPVIMERLEEIINPTKNKNSQTWGSSTKKVKASVFAENEAKQKFAKETLEKIQKNSPFALKVNFRLLELSKSMDFRGICELESNVATRLFNDPLVRAKLFSKSEEPFNWGTQVKDVKRSEIDKLFKNHLHMLPSDQRL